MYKSKYLKMVYFTLLDEDLIEFVGMAIKNASIHYHPLHS